MQSYDLLIVGAGPAGMTAAITARSYGLSVLLLDDQPAPGGQIWRSVENGAGRDEILGPSYSEGRPVAEAFRACGADYECGAKIWQVEAGFRVFYVQGERATSVEATAIILATGAQERPAPFPGWTTPGVLTVGAAQILLKSSGQVPAGRVWIAGSGPLPLLYAVQLLRAKGAIAGYLDTTPPGQWRSALRHLPRAMAAFGDLAKGLEWTAALRSSDTRLIKGVIDIEALGGNRLEEVRFRTKAGIEELVKADTLLIHEGVVPHLHAAMSLDCALEWNAMQECFVPRVDDWGQSSVDNLYIAGDAAGIAGAKAATLRGALAAIAVSRQSGRIDSERADADARPVRRKLRREMAARPFLDAMFRPRAQVFQPSDETIVCRCEEITAGEVRTMARIGRPGPNQIKTATRVGMGPCQGRQCGYSVTRMIAAVQQRTPAEVGFLHVRPPLKPITVGELASLDQSVAR